MRHVCRCGSRLYGPRVVGVGAGVPSVPEGPFHRAARGEQPPPSQPPPLRLAFCLARTETRWCARCLRRWRAASSARVQRGGAAFLDGAPRPARSTSPPIGPVARDRSRPASRRPRSSTCAAAGGRGCGNWRQSCGQRARIACAPHLRVRALLSRRRITSLLLPLAGRPGAPDGHLDRLPRCHRREARCLLHPRHPATIRLETARSRARAPPPFPPVHSLRSFHAYLHAFAHPFLAPLPALALPLMQAAPPYPTTLPLPPALAPSSRRTTPPSPSALAPYACTAGQARRVHQARRLALAGHQRPHIVPKPPCSAPPPFALPAHPSAGS